MLRKDRERDSAFALKIIEKCGYAVVSMTDSQGMPYCVPLSTATDGEYVYFHCARKGKKLDILRGNPQVCVCCVGDVAPAAEEFTTEYESAIFFGTARQVLDEEEKRRAMRLICEKYAFSNIGNFDKEYGRSAAVTDIWSISIDSITGKAKTLKKERQLG